jgi:hypothetical protein
MSGTEDDFEAQQPSTEPEPAAQPLDPVADAVESITFGDETAPAKLRNAIQAGVAEERYAQALHAETVRSQKILEDFLRENPQYADEDAVAVGQLAVQRLQREDIGAALDLKSWEETNGRPASPSEIAEWHKQHRAMGNPQMRDPRELLDLANERVREKFGIGRGNDLERSRHEAMAARAQRSAELTGKRVINWSYGKSSDSDPHITEIASSPETETSRGFGGDVVSPPDRSQAVADMIIHRRQLRQSVNPAGFTARGDRGKS